ncbi:hypothetical protein CYLTODRAFT_492298 [Cylindrobasidium torrendii FP15055 ss-10]|uniref:DUF6699 domain-containing protein n=1 Tax=Cylindrobasidium torrendii FP15055 ss-10 TaxID=1314674 RepID=A0A0D7B5J5_9AGAR|nr:hypothetical protein CYLTODRAFT_492298 [Cylindrobasidium torrendii FP15055 ss-10]
MSQVFENWSSPISAQQYPALCINEHYSRRRVTFLQQVKVRPFDRLLPTDSPPLRSEYELLRRDGTSTTNRHHEKNSVRTRNHNLPTGASSRRQPTIVNASPGLRVSPLKPTLPSSHAQVSSRQRLERPHAGHGSHHKRRDHHRSQGQRHQKRPSHPIAHRPVAFAHVSTKPAAKVEPTKHKKSARPAGTSCSQRPPHAGHLPTTRARQGPLDLIASTFQRAARSGSSSVTPALAPHSKDVPWDMRQPPTHQKGAHISSRILKQPALSSKSSSYMVFTHDLFPWPVLMHDGHAQRDLTIGDVLKTLSQSLQTHISARDLYNLGMGERTMGVMAQAARRRGSQSGSFRWVDFLGKQYMFGGLEQISGTHFRIRSYST